MTRAAQAYGVSVWTMYRALRELTRPKSVRRADHGTTKVAPQAEIERPLSYTMIPTLSVGYRPSPAKKCCLNKCPIFGKHYNRPK